MNSLSERLRAGPPRILLTGRPGSGKTTAVLRAVDLIGRDRCAGFYTEEVRRDGRRVGFDVVTVGGDRQPLARIGAPGPRVSRYGVDVPGFERVGVSALESGLEDPEKVLVVDEIGKMELHSERFRAVATRVLFEGSVPVLGTVMRGRDPLVDRIRATEKVVIVEVQKGNRDRLPAVLHEVYAGGRSSGRS
jgi:nucleoside-triphosphatase